MELNPFWLFSPVFTTENSIDLDAPIGLKLDLLISGELKRLDLIPLGIQQKDYTLEGFFLDMLPPSEHEDEEDKNEDEPDACWRAISIPLYLIYNLEERTVPKEYLKDVQPLLPAGRKLPSAERMRKLLEKMRNLSDKYLHVNAVKSGAKNG